MLFAMNPLSLTRKRALFSSGLYAISFIIFRGRNGCVALVEVVGLVMTGSLLPPSI